MFENLSVFRMSAAMASHAGHRQAIVAQNVAHADTPGYIAKDLQSFRSTYLPAEETGAIRATRAKHLHGIGGRGAGIAEMIEVPDQASHNGNQVSIETEMLKSVEAKRQHDRAIAIYGSAMKVLRASMQSR